MESSRYDRSSFAHPELQCDLVMKGGVTSGVVYPYAILEVAQAYRLRSIGGTSAGAIAAAFAAAAEFGRQRGDPGAFLRLETRCLALPGVLAGLFQPSAPFRAIMRALQAGSKAKGLGWLLAVAWPFWSLISASGVLGAAVMIGIEHALGESFGWWALPSAGLAAIVAVVVTFAWRVWRLLTVSLPAHNFGFCSGMAASGDQPVLTDWIYRSLQFIAFGDEAHPVPLTFGHLANLNLEEADQKSGHRNIDLRMITTNLSMRRPHALPDLGGDFVFKFSEWDRLFPAEILQYLKGNSPHDPARPVAPLDIDYGGYHRAPEPDDWPVVAAVRMSLSFPLLIEAVPMATRDLGPAAPDTPLAEDAKPKISLERVLFSDGGLSSNFPIHFFDALLPERPTFAFSLDVLEGAAGATPKDRVSMPQTAAAGSFVPIDKVRTTAAFASAILNSAKDWQDQLLSVMPGQRERIVHIKLAPDEGGLNLSMSEPISERLMEYGRAAGQTIKSDFDFDEHKWRRTLVLYEQLQINVPWLQATWPTFGAGFATYGQKSYKRVTKADKAKMAAAISSVANTAIAFRPGVITQRKFPRPSGRLRIVPDV